MEFLARLLGTQRVVVDDLPSFWRATEPLTREAVAIDRALLLGAAADRLGFAFAGGYAAALRVLVPELGETPTCLCATEAGGNHPRAIETRLTAASTGFVLDGHKRWATLGSLAEQALCVAKRGERDGRPDLVLVRVSLHAPGVLLESMPETAFVPEIPHASLRFEKVQVGADDVLPGDGYARYLKPFRTLEDLHVHAALLGYLLGVARRYAWPAAELERLLVLACAARDLARADATSPSMHLALGGLLERTAASLVSAEALWAQVDGAESARFVRDRPLLGVAGKAREARQNRARESLGLLD